MTKLIAAYTRPGLYPGYVHVTERDEQIVLTVRGDSTKRNGAYVCGHAPRDSGKVGRCTPGSEECNNYCNLAPQKGPMADRPAPCVHEDIGQTVALTLTKEEWAKVLKQLQD